MDARTSPGWRADDPRRTRVWRRQDLLADGLNDKAIAHLVATGVLHRVRYGTYVSATAWATCTEAQQHSIRVRAVLRRAQAEAIASHVSAALEWDVPMWDLPLDVVHTTRLDQRAGRREAGVVQHLGELRDGDVVARNGLAVTSPTRTGMDCAGLLGPEHAVAILGDLLHRNLTTKEELAAMAVFMTKWPGSLQHRLAIELADGRCESVGEHRTLFLCWKQGLPRPVPQHEVTDGTGRAYRLDFAWPEHKVWLEFDGRVKYQQLLRDGDTVTDAVLREKKREDAIRHLTGWRCLRMTWADLYHPERTAAVIRAALFPVDRLAG